MISSAAISHPNIPPHGILARAEANDHYCWVKKMKRFVAGSYVVIGGTLLLAVTFFLWQFMVPGILLRLSIGAKCPAWLTGVTALICLLVIQSLNGQLVFRGWEGPYEAIGDAVKWIVSLAIAVIIVRVGFGVANALVEGWSGSTGKSTSQADR